MAPLRSAHVSRMCLIASGIYLMTVSTQLVAKSDTSYSPSLCTGLCLVGISYDGNLALTDDQGPAGFDSSTGFTDLYVSTHLNEEQSKVAGIHGSGLRGIHGSGLRGIHGSGLRGIHGSGLRGIHGSGLRGIHGSGLRGIHGSGLRGIHGSGLRGIHGSGLRGIHGSGLRGIHGSGLRGIHGSGLRGIHGSGLRGIHGSGLRGIHGSGLRGIHGSGLRGIHGSGLRGIHGSGLRGIHGSGLRGIHGSGLRGIHGSGLRGIHGSGLRGIHGSGLRGIHGSGLRGIHGSGLRGIHGSGLRGIHGSGLRGIHGSGLRKSNEELNFASGDTDNHASSQHIEFQQIPLLAIGPFKTADGDAKGSDNQLNSVSIFGQRLIVDGQTAWIAHEPSSGYSEVSRDYFNLSAAKNGGYVAVAGDQVEAGLGIATVVIALPSSYVPGSSETYLRVIASQDLDSRGNIVSGETSIDSSNALKSDRLLVSSLEKTSIEYTGFGILGHETRFIAQNANVISHSHHQEPSPIQQNRTRTSSLNGIHGSGLRGIHGSGLRGIHGSGLRGIQGSGLRGIHGSGLRGIHGSGLRSEERESGRTR